MGLIRYLLTLSLMGLFCGCSTASKTVTATGKLAVGTASTAGKVTTRVTETTVKTTGSVATATVKGVASIARAGFVTFKDASTGTVRQVPWVQGMKVYAASKTAQLDMSLKAFQILRGSQVIKSDWSRIKSGSPEPELQPGDVVEVGQVVKRS